MPVTIRDNAEIKERARQLIVDEGLSWRTTAERLQLKPHTVRSWMHRYGWRHSTQATTNALKSAASQTASETGAALATEASKFIHQTIADCKFMRTKVFGMLKNNPDLKPTDAKDLVSSMKTITSMAREAFGLDRDTQGPNTLVQVMVQGPRSGTQPMAGKPVDAQPIDGEWPSIEVPSSEEDETDVNR